MSESSSVSRVRRSDEAVPAWAVAAVVAFAAVPRVLDALRNPLWFEEIYVLFLTRMGFAGMIRTLANDVEQPLHYVLESLWRGLGGEAELWLKSLSLLFGLTTVFVVYALGRALFGGRAGLMAAALLAANASHIYFSQVADLNALAWLLLPLTAWRGWRWIEQPSFKHALTFVPCVAASLYTYYFSAFGLATLALWGVVRLRRQPGTWLSWLGLFGVALLLFAPQMPTLAEQLTRDALNDRALPPMPARDLIDVFTKLTCAPLLLSLAIAALAVVPLLSRNRRSAAVMVTLMIALPTVLVWGLSRAGLRLFYERQLLFTLPFWAILAAGGAAALRPRALGALAVLVMALLGLRVWQGRGPLEEPAELAAASAYLAPRLEPGDLVLCAETHALLYFQYHLPGCAAYRLLVMPESPAFHYGDGILVVPDSCRIGPAAWADARARGVRSWGVHVAHFPLYRDGKEAAAALAARSAAPPWRRGKVTLWSGVSLVP